VLEESAANGVVYSETFLSPDFCGGGDVAAWREYLTAIREEAERAEAELGITLRGIVTCIRHFGPDRARPIARMRGGDRGRLAGRLRHGGR
jgi:adenosine deaminase